MTRRAGMLTALILLVLSGGTATAEPNPALSRLYTSYALSAFEEGRLEEARSFAQTALDFSGENADAHHILARSRADEQASTPEVVDGLERALAVGGFRATEEREARLLLAETYLRTDRPEDALRVLEAATETGERDPDLRYLTARAYLGIDRVREAERVALEGRRLHPQDPRFFLLLLRRDPMPGPQSGRWLDENVSDHPAYLRALLYYADRITNAARTLELTNRYLILGGDDPRVAVIRARAMPADGATAEPERSGGGLGGEWQRFVRLGGLSDKDATEEMYELLPDGDLRERARGVLSAYDGTAFRDREADGFWEQRFVFEGGVAARWQVDRNQDGDLEYDIEMADRVPRRLPRTPEGFELVYGSYPEVAGVTITDGELQRRYRIRPGRLLYPLLSEELDWGASTPGPAFPHRLTQTPPLLSEELLRPEAYRLEIGAAGGPVRRVLTLDGGTVLREVRDEDTDGEIDHVIAYAEGTPVSGMRDADRDGRFEISEQYENGELALILVDSDGDGEIDYRERLLPQRSYAWDYDEDGSVDARELVTGQNEVLRQFSIDDDGDFDLSMQVYREGVGNE